MKHQFLSQDLTGPRHPLRCQRCGAEADIERWQEHDLQDAPLPLIVVLCAACSDELIVPHPRLYRALDHNEPFPGSMPACLACLHRDGTRCTHGMLKANGGPGLQIISPKPMLFHLDFRDKAGRRRGETFSSWAHNRHTCAGRVEREDAGGAVPSRVAPLGGAT